MGCDDTQTNIFASAGFHNRTPSKTHKSEKGDADIFFPLERIYQDHIGATKPSDNAASDDDERSKL